MICPACLSKNTAYRFDKNGFRIEECKKCGLFFCSKVPTAEKLKKYYEKDEYCCKKRNAFIVKLENKYFLRRFRKYIKKNSVILDYGCGKGELIEILNKRGHYAEGVDLSQRNKEIGRKKGIKINSGLDPKKKRAYDIIIMRCSLEHMAEPILLINKLKNALKDGGYLFIDVPNINSKDFKVHGKNWVIVCPPYHLLYFSKKSMNAFLKNNGFKIIKLEDSKIPSYIFPFNTPLIFNVFIKIAYLMIPSSLIKSEGSSLMIIAKKC